MNKNAHILIVDDEPDTVEILSRQLSLENYKVIKAYSGKESLELLKKHKPDLILMDIMMPEMDGFETVRIIRDTVKEFIPIIIVTASKDDTESIARGFAVGANDYIVIPCNKEELLARIKAMLRIKELHDALEEKNLKLTEACTELENTRASLTQSEKLAVMGRLIADVSHEINNPLAIITGNTYLLEGMVKEQVTAVPDLADSAKMFEKIKKAINRCRHIVASLLVSTGPTILDIKPTDMNKLIEESLESMDDRLKRQNVKVVKVFTPRLPIIEADGHRLSQVFINMFSNAFDAMPQGGKLRIATRFHTPEAGAPGKATGEESPAIEIEISDTGEGIGEDDLFKIFDPFVTTKMDGKGVGLGLSISSGIVREHGGDISVTSKKDKGATFIIRLPVKGGHA